MGLFATHELVLCAPSLAALVSRGQVQKAVNTWLAEDPRPMNSHLGNRVENIEAFADANGRTIYYIAYLRPDGFVIVSADDLIEPIVGFLPKGSYDPSEGNPLGALVSRDLPGRVHAAKTIEGTNITGITGREAALRDSAQKSRAKWAKLLADTDDNDPPFGTLGVGSISDTRVAPLLQTKWGQTTINCDPNEYACFNYYTPPYSAGSTGNYPCGCVATAMAQYMRFWQYPTAGVGTPCFTIYVDGSAKTRCLRGGDGSGGPYNWSQMAPEPNCNTAESDRQAIGALTHDAGVAVEMQYEPGSSGAYMSDLDSALVNTFYYSNSIFGWKNNNNIGPGLDAMVNPNLDYGNPVILGVSGPGVGHAIVADGYGYNSSTLYHHLNLGWEGTSDAWYNLPNIDSSPYSFSVVDSAIYNIYISGSGEIISGRITAAGLGTPIPDATVTAQRTGGGTYQAITNYNGIYAIAEVPSNSTYTISVSKAGYSFTDQVTSTGRSQDWQATSGNCWAVDFTGTTTPGPPTASDSNATVEQGLAELIMLQAADDGLPNPPGALTYIITSLPYYGTLSDPCGSDINVVPHVLADCGRTVTYTSISCYTGDDAFQFKVNDGGSPPTGGDSNTATVSITIELPARSVVYETDFNAGLPAGWTIIDGGASADTWRCDNPAGRTSPYWTGVFMIVDSDNAGEVNMDEQLISPGLDCTNLTGVKLRFNHDFYYWSEEMGDVDIRIDGGQWQNAARYQGADYAGPVELALSALGADGNPNVQIRWHYYNANWEYYWGIDDVQITGSFIAPTPPLGDFEPDCDVDYDDLAVLTSAWLTSPGQGNWNPDCDISEPNDGIINQRDYAAFALNWLMGTE